MCKRKNVDIFTNNKYILTEQTRISFNIGHLMFSLSPMKFRVIDNLKYFVGQCEACQMNSLLNVFELAKDKNEQISRQQCNNQSLLALSKISNFLNNFFKNRGFFHLSKSFH